MRVLLITLLTFTPLGTAAWEFTPDPICTLSDDNEHALIEVTYDPRLPEYALHITLKSGTWREAPVFGITFQGGGEDFSIQTDRHTLSNNGATLTVRDRGFGNVLNGIEFRTAMRAGSGSVALNTDTVDAAPAVQAFRACPSDVPATS